MMAWWLVPVWRLMDLLVESLTLSVVAGGSKSSQLDCQLGWLSLYIYFTTTDTTNTNTSNTTEIINNDSLRHFQTVCSSTLWLKIQQTQSGKMFPPAQPVIFDYLMLNTPSDASCTPVYSCTARQKGGRGTTRTRQNQYWAWGGERGQVWLLLSAQTVSSTLRPHTSHQCSGLNTL